jgi:hypothetical protein
MSPVSGVGTTPYLPVVNDMNKPVGNQQPQTPPVQPVAKDADGDNDASVGKNIDVRA